MPQLAPFTLWFCLMFVLVIPFLISKVSNPIKNL